MNPIQNYGKPLPKEPNILAKDKKANSNH